MQPDQIELEVKEKIKLIPKTARAEGWEWTRSLWTKSIKIELCNLAHQPGYGYIVSANECPGSDWQEWLYDMVWCKETREFLSFVPLVMESELNAPHELVDGDFQKLLLAKAKHRVWIFERTSQEEVQKSFESCINHIKNFEDSTIGDRYLLLGVDWNPREFQWKLYVHE